MASPSTSSTVVTEVDDNVPIEIAEDPRIVWILERVMAFCRTKDKNLVVHMLEKHNSRALRKLYRLIHHGGPMFLNGFFVYQTQYRQEFKKMTKNVKIHLQENEEEKYKCSVEYGVRSRNDVAMQLHLHFDVHRWERFPHKGMIFYFLPRQETCAPLETVKEAQALMPQRFYTGQVDLRSVRNFRSLFSVLQLYVEQIFVNPTNPFSSINYIPASLRKIRENLKKPSIFEIENSSSYMKKYEDIVKMLTAEDVPIYPKFNLQLFKRLDNYGVTKRRDKFNIYTIDDFLNAEVFARNPKIRSLWYKKKKGNIPKFKDRTQVGINDLTPPKGSVLSALGKFIQSFDWCISKVSQCTLSVLYTDFLAKLDVHKFDHNDQLKETHLIFLKGVLEIWTLHVKNLLKYCDTVQIKGKGVLALYEFYKERRDKISNLIFEMFHPIVENLLNFVTLSHPKLVFEFKRIRSQLENFYIICWDTCEYLEFCLMELEIIHNHKLLRPIVNCAKRCLNVLKLLLTLSFYWKSRNRFLDILNRLHYTIQSKIERVLNTEHLFQLPNRVASALCNDVIHVSEFWQSTVEEDRSFSQKINFEKLIHLRNVAQSILGILRVMKSYNHIFCQQCYDAENENYKLDAVVYEVNQLTQPVLSPTFDYLDVDNKLLWNELVSSFKARCAAFDKEASLLIIDAIRKTKSTKNIANILTHFKSSTKIFNMQSLFDDIFNNLDVSPQFTQEILLILEIFLKASYYKDSMRSFGLASKSMQWTRCLFYVVQKNLSILFSIGAALANVFDKVISNYLRCVDIFTSYEVGLYKVWLKRFVNYTHNVVSKQLIKIAYAKDDAQDDDGCRGFLDFELFNKLSLTNEPNVQPVIGNDLAQCLPQFRPYLMDSLQEEQLEKLASLRSFSSKDDLSDTGYKDNLLIKYGLDLNNWYVERHLLNYNFVTKLALGMCTQNDEQLEANVYFLLEQTLKRFFEPDERDIRKNNDKSNVVEGENFFHMHDCCSSSGSVTRISELLTENSWSVYPSDDGIEEQVNNFFVDTNPRTLEAITDLNYLKNDDLPLFIAIRENFKDMVNVVVGGDPVELKAQFKTKTEEVLAKDVESACSEEFSLPESVTGAAGGEPPTKPGIDDLKKYNVLFQTSINNLYNYKEMEFVLWLNGTKMKYVKTKTLPMQVGEVANADTSILPKCCAVPIICGCGKSANATNHECPKCQFDWINFDPGRKHLGELPSRYSSQNDDDTVISTIPKMNECARPKKRKTGRSGMEKYEKPMNDIFVQEDNADNMFRRKFNIYLVKLINDAKQPGETIPPNDISGRVRGSLLPDGTRSTIAATLQEITDDDIPDQKISSEINKIIDSQKTSSKRSKRTVRKELQEAIKQADVGSSESEKVMKIVDYENEIRKTVPGIYTGCKHSLRRMTWMNFIGSDMLKEHDYTIQANREPFTNVACRDIEAFEELGFTLPPDILAFAFNNFDRNKHDIFEIVTMYKGIIAQLSSVQVMALKPYIRAMERDICQGLDFCGLRTLNITKQCKELIVKMNRLSIVVILMSEVEGSIKNTLQTIGRIIYYQFPSQKSYSMKAFFHMLNDNMSSAQRRLTALYKLIPQKLLKMETLLFQQRTGKCEYMILYYRCVEKMLFKKLVDMVKANLFIYQKFVVGRLRAKFHITLNILEPNISVNPELIQVYTHLQITVEKLINFQKHIPRWFDGTCAKVPLLKLKNNSKNTHSYSFAEDLMGSEDVVCDLQQTYECISYVLDSVEDYLHKWTRFEHLWLEDIEDVFAKFSLMKPTLQNYFDVFNFYHQIIVEIYRMPEVVDIFCVRVKIKDAKKKVLLYALGWRAFAKNSLNDSIVAESQALFTKMQSAFMTMAEKVTSFDSMKRVLKTAYLFGNLEMSADILLSSITAKNMLAKLWMPQHMYEESSVRKVIAHNIKQMKTLSIYRRAILMPYLNKITPRLECIQCAPIGIISDLTKKMGNAFPKTLSAALKEQDFGSSMRNLMLPLIDELDRMKDTCSWSVVLLTLEHLRQSVLVLEWMKMLHPKITLSKLQTSKAIQKLLGIEKLPVVDASDQSLDSLLKMLR